MNSENTTIEGYYRGKFEELSTAQQNYVRRKVTECISSRCTGNTVPYRSNEFMGPLLNRAGQLPPQWIYGIHSETREKPRTERVMTREESRAHRVMEHLHGYDKRGIETTSSYGTSS